MKLRITLAALVLSNSMAFGNYFNKGMDIAYRALEEINELSSIDFHGFRIDIKKKRMNYENYPNLYFLVKQDHNGEYLYVLTYSKKFNVQSYLKRLQQIARRGAN
jgi:hypothetical protein